MTSELTGSNMMMGTLNYMAPEQIRGERIDHRAAIFSVGVPRYELLSGRKAFAVIRLVYAFQDPERGARTAAEIDPTLPPDLVAVVERALSEAARRALPEHGREAPRSRDLPAVQLGDSPMSGRPISDRQQPPSCWRGPVRGASGSGTWIGTDLRTGRHVSPSRVDPPPAPVSSAAFRGARRSPLRPESLPARVVGLWLGFNRSNAEPTSRRRRNLARDVPSRECRGARRPSAPITRRPSAYPTTR